MPAPRSLALLAALVACSAAVASGVTYALVRHDSGTSHKEALPPIAFVGVLRDTSGKPVAHAWIQLTAMDSTIDKIGAVVPTYQLAGAFTDAAGRFTIRQPQSVPIIRKLAASNGNWVNFDLEISANGGFMPWSIPRQISHHVWLADDQGTPATSKVERLTFKPF